MRNTRPDWVSRGNLEHHLAVERRHLDRAAEGRGGEADRHLAGQVAALALEDRVLAHADLDVQVARRAAVAARLALAVQADAIARCRRPAGTLTGSVFSWRTRPWP